MWGLLYDVHGNLPALEAVLADTQTAGVERFVVGGDVALFGAWPAETLARLRGLPEAVFIRGNTERWLAEDPGTEPASSARVDAGAELGSGTVDELDALPFDHRIGETLCVHASTVDDMRSFLPEPGEDEAELLADVPADVGTLVFGHTHLQFERSAGLLRLVNPGSVGMPLDGDPRAAWAILHDDGHVEMRRVEYDHAASAAELSERFGDAPWVPVIAARVRDARA